ncbi:hypothetical protein [Agromyces bauzanensis]
MVDSRTDIIDAQLELITEFQRLSIAESPTTRRGTAIAGRWRELVLQDPAAAAELDRVPNLGPLPPADPFDGLKGMESGVDWIPDISQGPRLRALNKPYDYSDKAGNATLSPDHVAGHLYAGCTVASFPGYPDSQGGIAYIGMTMSSSQTVRLRVSPLITWTSGWILRLNGFAEAGASPPWADWRVTAKVQVFDHALLAETSQELVHARHEEAPGAGWEELSDWNGGTVAPMHAHFTIVAGHTVWVIVGVEVKGEVDYSWQSAASAQCGTNAELRLVWVERL